jgi:hypothetical protein
MQPSSHYSGFIKTGYDDLAVVAYVTLLPFCEKGSRLQFDDSSKTVRIQQPSEYAHKWLMSASRWMFDNGRINDTAIIFNSLKNCLQIYRPEKNEEMQEFLKTVRFAIVHFQNEFERTGSKKMSSEILVLDNCIRVINTACEGPVEKFDNVPVMEDSCQYATWNAKHITRLFGKFQDLMNETRRNVQPQPEYSRNIKKKQSHQFTMIDQKPYCSEPFELTLGDNKLEVTQSINKAKDALVDSIKHYIEFAELRSKKKSIN